jgi:hypothetical protein
LLASPSRILETSREDYDRFIEEHDEDMVAFMQRLRKKPPHIMMPLLIADTILPRQRLKITSSNTYLDDVAARGEEIGVFGFAVGGRHAYRHGVTATVTRIGEGQYKLHGQRHAQVLNTLSADGVLLHGPRLGMVEFVEDKVDAADMETAGNLVPLVKEWRARVEGSPCEQFVGQIRKMVEELGPMPSAVSAGDLALWVAALVTANPSCDMGVPAEIRPAVLAAGSVADRLRIVRMAIDGSNRYILARAPSESLKSLRSSYGCGADPFSHSVQFPAANSL